MRFRMPFRTVPVLVAAIAAGTFFLSPASDFFDLAFYDAVATASVKNDARDENVPPYSKIVLVTVDDATVERYGNQAFWTRTRYRQLLDRLELESPKAVYFDYFFSEKTKPETVDWDLLAEVGNLGEDFLDDLFSAYDRALKSKNFISEIDYDFARAIKRYGNVFLPALIRRDVVPSETVTAPLEIFTRHARIGFANSFPDSDGVERRVKLWWEGMDSVAALLAREISPELSFVGNDDVMVRFASTPYGETFAKIPFEFAYNGRMETDEGVPVSLSGAVVIVGDYSENSWDLHAVPTGDGALMSGMEVIAHAVRSLSEKDFLVPYGKDIVALSALSAFVLVTLAFFPGGSVLAASILSAFVFVLPFVFAWKGYGVGVWFPPSSAAFAVLSAALSGWYVVYRSNRAEKDRIRKMFSRYVDPSVVEVLTKGRTAPNPEGELREVSVLFADVEGFTTASESLSPTESVARLNVLFSKVNSAIFATRWAINKYIGDAVMAYWGAPVFYPDHASSACDAALLMLDSTASDAQSGLALRIGIATGEVLVGNVGDERFSDFTVMGDRVNFASRLEGLTRKYGARILVSEKTSVAASKTHVFREIDRVRVKGKTVPERIFELLGDRKSTKEETRKNAKRFARALALYRRGDFESAGREFRLLSESGDPIAGAFVVRMAEWNGKPPEGFDGTYSFDSK